MAMTPREKELLLALTSLLKAYDMVLPGIRYISVTDYALINDAPVKARSLVIAAVTEKW
jgi:hypothetical protein